MALTTAQQSAIRSFLGYADIFRYKNPRLEGVLAPGLLSADAETLVDNILTQLAAVDAALTGTGGSPGIAQQAAGVKKLDEIEFFEGRAIRDLKRIGRMLITRLSTILGVPPYSDYYGEEGYPGDTYSADGLASGSGGNTIPMG